MSSPRIRDAARWTIFIFRLGALAFGIVSLLHPELVLSARDFNVVDRASRA